MANFNQSDMWCGMCEYIFHGPASRCPSCGSDEIETMDNVAANNVFNFMLDVTAQAAAFTVAPVNGEWCVVNRREGDKLVAICASESLAQVIADSLNGVSIP